MARCMVAYPQTRSLGLTFVVMWLLSRSNNLYNISLVVALCSTPVLNNLIIIAGMK